MFRRIFRQWRKNDFIRIAQVASQDGIGQSVGRRSDLLGDFDGFIDHGKGRQPVAEFELIQTGAQNVFNAFVHSRIVAAVKRHRPDA